MPHICSVFVIQEAEKLSNEAQAGLRRTLERCISNARVILHCQNLSAVKFIDIE